MILVALSDISFSNLLPLRTEYTKTGISDISFSNLLPLRTEYTKTGISDILNDYETSRSVAELRRFLDGTQRTNMWPPLPLPPPATSRRVDNWKHTSAHFKRLHVIIGRCDGLMTPRHWHPGGRNMSGETNVQVFPNSHPNPHPLRQIGKDMKDNLPNFS